jgi:cytidylate kinase
MTIITISRGSYSRGKEIAEKVAEKLGYECVARDVLLETSEDYHIPEIKLVRAIHDAPTILERFGYSKEKYIAYFKSDFLKHMRKDNVVYHGLAGHFLLQGVSHVLKVRIVVDMEDRIQLEMEREKISEKEAAKVLKNDDEERRKWSQYLFGIDTWDPSLYDLVIHIRKITTDLAVEIICSTAKEPQFQTTPESMSVMDDLLLSAEVYLALVPLMPQAEVSAKDGAVMVKARGNLSQELRLSTEVKEILKDIPGVKEVAIDISPIMAFNF